MQDLGRPAPVYRFSANDHGWRGVQEAEIYGFKTLALVSHICSLSASTVPNMEACRGHELL